MRALAFAAALLGAFPATADVLTLAPTTVTDWKQVYGLVSPREEAAARARIGGIVTDLTVSEGDTVVAGQRLATIRDDKLGFQIAAFDAQIEALRFQLATAETELGRGETLVERGVTTAQRLDQLRTTVDVTRSQIAAAEAGRAVVVAQSAEGDVLAPQDGRVLTVPAARGAVLLAGEPVAIVASGGFFLRLSVPERHAADLAEGASIEVGTPDGAIVTGRLAKVYPQIAGGRVTADVDVTDLPAAFVGTRIPVALPVAERQALVVPLAAVETRGGVDFVTTLSDGVATRRAVLLGEPVAGDGVEIVGGLVAGDQVVLP